MENVDRTKNERLSIADAEGQRVALYRLKMCQLLQNCTINRNYNQITYKITYDHKTVKQLTTVDVNGDASFTDNCCNIN